MSKHLPVASRRVSRSAVLGFVLLVAASLAASSFLGAAAAADPMERVERQVLADLAAGEGEATFWVHLREKADLRAAPGIRNRAERGRFVYRELTATAARGQAGLLALLRARGVDHEAFWITNTIRVTGDEELLRQIASRPEVEQITADRVYELPEPLSAAEEAQVNPVEWGIERINAPQVWSEFGARGEGIVVANIDSGVQFDHPALVRQYRGNAGGGNFDHDYNWFDPSNICASPSTVPCDNSGHGTHTMGTMVGDDGDPGPNQIGVAPHATWIAAKGCETNNCSFSAILAAGQWVLAPCRLDGSDCDPARRPHVVNNSWGGGSGDPFYRETVNAWVASGIFPAFASGNSGPSCSTAGSPGDYPESYSAGAFNIDGNIAGFSSRGASFYDGAIKPNIAAPGVDVRSSFPGDRYVSATGTSMASPHVAATVALMWSAAPALERDISRTEALLNQTAIDMSDLSCGGTAENNNVWGEGRLDAFAAVQASPRGPSGTLSGTVTDAGNGDPIGGATIHVRGPFDREAVTDANGRYSTRLPVGTYDLTASGFGYASETTNGVVISQGQTMAQDFALHAVASHTISGHVRDPRGGRVRNAIVRVLGTPIPPATTNAQGFYSFASVPEGTYTVSAQSRCHDVQSQQLLVAGDETLDLEPPIRQDGFGYSCQMTESQWLDADTELPLDKIRFDAGIMVDLPFPFPFYGKPYTRTGVNMNGLLCLSCDGAEGWTGGGWRFPRSAPFGSALIAPFWDSLALDREASVRTKLIGEAPSRGLVIEWRNMLFRGIDTTRRVDFETILFENGDIVFQYRNINSEAREQGIAAAVGLQNEGGTIAFQYSFHEPALADGLAVRFRVPLTATVAGTVTDANDVQPIQGATVRVLQDGTELRRAVTGSDGAFRLVHLPLGMYTLEAESDNYETRSIIVAFDHEDEVATKNLSLRTARAEITPHALEFIVIPGHTKSKAVDLANTGSVPLTWDLRPVTGRVSVGPNGSEADRASLYPAISADGRYVAFESNARNLVPGDGNRISDVFVYDRQTGVTERISVATGGAEANEDSFAAAISADGRYVAFQSLASNLVPGDENGATDIFVHDRQTGVTERVSVATGGAEATHDSTLPTISADGRYVAFESNASDLVPGDQNRHTDVFVHDRQSRTTERVSVATGGAEANHGSQLPAISGDGRYVAFRSAASNLVPGDQNGQIDIFVHDRRSRETERVSLATGGSEGNRASSEPTISADGRYVAFSSVASNLVLGDTNDVRDIFVHDREIGATERISVATDGAEANQESDMPAISADGRHVAFESNASNLIVGDQNRRVDIFVYDRAVGATERVSVATTGNEANEFSAAAAISANGTTIAFHSLASNLVPGDQNEEFDVFVHDVGSTVPWLSQQPPSGTVPPGRSEAITVTVDAMHLGKYFTSIAFRTNSGRQPAIRVPVSLVVTEYVQWVNAGGPVYADTLGDEWAADRAYSAGSWGYVGRSRAASEKKPIGGTADDGLYQSARVGVGGSASGGMEYRFDVPVPGMYEVELHFAELVVTKPGLRVFDVLAEGEPLLSGYDPVKAVGALKADKRAFLVSVTDGRLNLVFGARRGYLDPIVNAIRVVRRP